VWFFSVVSRKKLDFPPIKSITKDTNLPQMYVDDNVIEEFYKALANQDEGRLRRVHIPRSDVFYVREKILQDTGIKYTLDHVERAMYLEGHLEAKDVFKPRSKREWE
tara:strand:+ start:539 stop:859 length:321 start_codon:yes stop_codon:yes gene_type:complete